jgi:hypothetical protein
MVVPANSFFETQTPQQLAELVKGDIRVRCTSQDAGEKVVVPGHTESYTVFDTPCITYSVLSPKAWKQSSLGEIAEGATGG